MNQNDKDQNKVSEFYDDFSIKQIKTGLNLRHYHLASELAILKENKIQSILEIGCGIGTFTSLVAKTFPNANITGVDISKNNVSIARSRLKSDRFEFVQADFSDESPLNKKKYDLLIFADVLEHIPVERYSNLFQNISNHCEQNAFLFINIPHPQIINYLRKTNPDLLQIVDQPITQDVLFPQFLLHNLTLVKMMDYSLTHKESDYVLYVLKAAPNLIESYHQIPKWKISWRKLIKRING